MKFRVVKFTRLNGEVFWTVQREFKHWLTRKPVWKYYASYVIDTMYTENINWAEEFGSEKRAIDTMNELIKATNTDIVGREIIKTVITDTYGKRDEE